MKKHINYSIVAALFIGVLALSVSCSTKESGAVKKASPAKQLVMDSIKAHGGIDRWRKNGLLQFRWKYHMEDLGKVVDSLQVIDPVAFDAKHTTPDDSITFGLTGGKFWQVPVEAKFGVPPRFWTLTPLYFVGVPFVFDDEQANFEMLTDTMSFEGKEYSQVKITYKAGAGDSPDDYYVVLIDPETKVTRAAYYTVTNPIVYKGGPVPEKLITFDNLKDFNGVMLPTGHKTYKMENGKIGKQVRFTEVSEIKYLPRSSVDFSIPEGAKILNE